MLTLSPARSSADLNFVSARLQIRPFCSYWRNISAALRVLPVQQSQLVRHKVGLAGRALELDTVRDHDLGC